VFRREKLVRLRRKHKLSLEQMGRLCGVDPSTWHCWEKGKRTPSIGSLQKVAQALRVDVWFFLN